MILAAAAAARSRFRLRCVVVLLIVTSCVAAGLSISAGSASAASTPGQRALAWAKARIGTPYVWGGASDSGYDCSGLAMRAYQSVGIALDHSSAAQYRETAAHRVAAGHLEPGDLMFYGSSASSIYHVGIFAYYSNGRAWMIDASHSGVPVGYHSQYSGFYAATRPAGGTGIPAPTIKAPASVAANHAFSITGTGGPGSEVRIWSKRTNGTDNRLFARVHANSTGGWSYSLRLGHNRFFTAASAGGNSATVRTRAIWPLTINAPVKAPEGAAYYVWGHVTDYVNVKLYGAPGAGTGGYRLLAGRHAASNGNWAVKLTTRRTWRFYAAAQGRTTGVRQTNVLRYPVLHAPLAVAVGSGTRLSGTATALSTVTVYFRRGGGPWGVAGSAKVSAARSWSIGARQRAQVSAYAKAAGLTSKVVLIRYIYRPTIAVPASVGGKTKISLSGTGPAGWPATVYSAVTGSNRYSPVATTKVNSTGRWTMTAYQGRSRKYYVRILGVTSALATSTIKTS